jgi:D-xylonolactonase
MEKPVMVADYACLTGEGPLWHPVEQRLYWVDIPAGRLFRYDPGSDHSEVFNIGAPVGGFTLQADGALLLFMARGTVRVWRDGRLAETVIPEIPDERDNRFNDVIADPAGRVFCGVMSTATRAGRLYRLDPDGTLHQILDGIGTSNGLGFSPDRRQMYYTDTRAYAIYRFDYDQSSGDISNQHVFAQVPQEPSVGRPDGLTVDSEGCVWSARWDGGRIVRYAPDGRELGEWRFPARKVSSLTFAGPDYRDIYVTTAGGDNRSTNGPGAGALFRLNCGVKGVPEFRSRIGMHDG